MLVNLLVSGSLLASSLIIDIGNSHMVGAFFDGDKMVEKIRVAETDDFVDNLETLLEDHISNITDATIGSVNRRVSYPVAYVLEKNNIPYKFINKSKLNLEFQRVDPSGIGTDLLANAYGALDKFPGNCIVVDVGSAITVQAVSHDRKFLGGAIAPGMNMSSVAMHEKTYALPRVTVYKPEKSSTLDTPECIRSGIYWSSIGGIEHLVDETRKEWFPGEDVTVVATGGVFSDTSEENSEMRNTFGDAIKGDLSHCVDFFDPELTLYGLFLMSKEA
ncbi:MAG: type III pantothenate kinase [Chlamydiales bacterium]|jgi:type III pantothenate kinase